MKVAAPLCSADEVVALVRAGADELFCGVLGQDRAPGFFPNARDYASANLASFAELERTVASARPLGVPVVFCANRSQGGVQTQWLKADILRACEAGAAGVIIADPTLLPWAARHVQGRTLIASTMTAALNSRALEFLARAGAGRVVLERQLTLSEIEALAAHARVIGLDLEVIVNNQGCVHVNGSCDYHEWLPAKLSPEAREAPRGPRAMPCRTPLPLKIWTKAGDSYRQTGLQPDYAPAARSSDVCAACSLLRLRAAGVAYAKVVHRHFPLAQKVQAVSMTKEYLTLLENGRIGSGEHISAGRRLFQKHYGRDCLREYCIHHEIYAQRGEDE